MPEVKARTRLTFHQLVDGQSSYTHIRYSNDGRTFTPASAEALEKAVDYPIEGRNIFVAKYGLRRTYVGTNIQNQTGALGAFSPIIEHHLNKRYMRISARVEFINCTFADNSMLQFQGNGRTYGWGPAVRLHKATGYTLANGVYDISTVVDATNGQILRYQTSTEMLLRIDYITGTIKVSNIKYEFVDSLTSLGTPYSPSPEDAAIGTTAGRWRGEMVSDSPIASTDFSVYTWVDTKGEKGDTGRSVTSMKTQFALSSSSTNAPTGGWVDVAPNWEPNTYLWTRIHTTYSDGSTSATNAVLDNAWETKKMLSFSDDNLLLAADFRGAPISNQNHPIGIFSLSEDGKKLTTGEQVTLVFKGSIASSGRAFAFFNSEGNMVIGEVSELGNGLYYSTVPWKVGSNGQNSKIFLYVRNNLITPTVATIEWVKLVRGTHTSLQYTPSQEELKKSVDAAKARAEDTYTKAAADGIISRQEAIALNTSRAESLKAQMEYDKAKIDAQYNQVITIVQGALKTAIIAAKGSYDNAYNGLYNGLTSFLGVTWADTHTATMVNNRYKTDISSSKRTAYGNALTTLSTELSKALGYQELGGINLFGRHRDGVSFDWMGGNTTPSHAPSLNGVVVRVDNVVGLNHLLRIRGLGLGKPGFYTAGFEVRVVRKDNVAYSPSSPNAKVDICDAGSKWFTLSGDWQSVVTTADVTSYYNSPYNGFFDLEVNSSHGLAIGDVIEVRNLMIERGNVSSGYSPSPEDGARFSALVDEALQISEMRAGVDGGAVFGGRLLAQDQGGNVRAFMNGLTNGVRPAFAAGVTGFGSNSEDYATAFYHDGSGHLKNLYFNGAEEGLYMGSDPNTALVKFTTAAMPTIEQLVADRTRSTTMAAETLRVSGVGGRNDVVSSRGTLSVVNINGRLEGRARLQVTGTPKVGPFSRPQVVIMIHFLNEHGAKVGGFLSTQYAVDGRVFEEDLSGRTLPLGTHTIIMETYPSDVINYTAELTMLTPFRYVAVLDRGVYGIYRNGILAYENEYRYAEFRNGQLKVRGEIDTDSPVVLLAGRVNSSGQAISYLGIRKHSMFNTQRLQNGIYRVHHSIGHKNYVPTVTPSFVSGRHNVVQIGEISNTAFDLHIRTMSGGYEDVGFTFTIVGTM